MVISGSRDGGSYPLEILPNHDAWILGTRPMFEAIIRDLVCNTPAGIISARFHNGLVDNFVRVATLLRQNTGLNRVCLSGGTFNNRYLTEHLCGKLTENAFEVFTQWEVPCGDGGLSLGQAMIATQSVR